MVWNDTFDDERAEIEGDPIRHIFALTFRFHQLKVELQLHREEVVRSFRVGGFHIDDEVILG